MPSSLDTRQPVVMPQDTRAVGDAGDLTPAWQHLMTVIVRRLNELEAELLSLRQSQSSGG